MCPGKVDEFPICPGNLSYLSWIKDISQGWYTATCFFPSAFFVVGFSDRFGKPSGGVRVKTLRPECQFFAPKIVGHVPFCQALGLNHWGGARLQGACVRLTWEACFDVRVKTRVVQICQVRRQVHLADVFDGGLFVIKLGRTKILQTWNSSCNSQGAPKMTSNLVPTVNTF